MKSYHDYQIYGYEVDSLNRVLKFKLAWPNQDKEADIVWLAFSGVHGYELMNDAMVSIVLDFEEIPISSFLNDYSPDIKDSYRQNGAYGPWAGNLEEAEANLNSSGVKAFVLSSSLGMVGWVLAEKIEA